MQRIAMVRINRASTFRESTEYKILVENYGIETAEEVAREKEAKVKLKSPPSRRLLTLEKNVQNEIKKFLSSHARVLWQNNTGGLIRGNKIISNPNVGMPDLMGILKDGRFFAFEVKSPDVKWPPAKQHRNGLPAGDWKRYCLQNAWLRRLEGENTIVAFVNSVEQVKQLIK